MNYENAGSGLFRTRGLTRPMKIATTSADLGLRETVLLRAIRKAELV